jgi:hypothetical protein
MENNIMENKPEERMYTQAEVDALLEQARVAPTADAREAALEAREREISRRELRAEAMEALSEKRLPVRLAELLDYSSAEACEKSIETLEAVLREAIQEAVDARIARPQGMLRRNSGHGENALMQQVRGAMGLKPER